MLLRGVAPVPKIDGVVELGVGKIKGVMTPVLDMVPWGFNAWSGELT